MTRRQPLEARVWGSLYRSWYPQDPSRQKRKAKRRSAKRERARARREIRDRD